MATVKKSAAKGAAPKAGVKKGAVKKSSAKSSASQPAAKTAGTKSAAKKTAAKKTAVKKTTAKKGSSRKYGPLASEDVRLEMHEMKRGQLHIGKSDEKVTNPKQAIAIGLAKARREGGKVPPNPNTGR